MRSRKVWTFRVWSAFDDAASFLLLRGVKIFFATNYDSREVEAAKQKPTATLSFQISGKPKRGSVNCKQEAVLTVASGEVATSATS